MPADTESTRDPTRDDPAAPLFHAEEPTLLEGIGEPIQPYELIALTGSVV